MRAFRRATAETQVWQTRETLLACIGPSDVDEKVVRTAARLAAKLDSAWHAVYVETPALQRLPERSGGPFSRRSSWRRSSAPRRRRCRRKTRSRRCSTMRGATISARIVVGRSTRARARWPGRQSFSRATGSALARISTSSRWRARKIACVPRRPPSVETGALRDQAPAAIWGYASAVLTCVGITAIATPLRHHIDLANIVMLFLLGVVFVAYRFGRGPAVLAAVLSVASFDFFFVPPRLTFAVSDVQYLLTFAVMLIVGLVTGHLTAGLRYQARVARYREERARSLYEMARSLSSALVEEQVVDISDKFVEASFSAKVAILLPDLSDKLQTPRSRGGTPAYDLAVAQWCYRQERAGRRGHRHAAGEPAALPAAQGPDAGARRAGDRAEQSAPAHDPGAAPPARHLRRADRDRARTHSLRVGRPGHAHQDGVGALAQHAARGAVPRPAHAAHGAGRIGGDAVAAIWPRRSRARGEGRRDPRTGAAHQPAGEQPAGDGQAAVGRRQAAQGLAVARGDRRAAR